jgi:hypothetical protein
MQEPEWVKAIPSGMVCQWFYVFFWIYASLAVLTVVVGTGLLGAYKLPLGLKLGLGFSYFLALAIQSVFMLFFYIMCDRSINQLPVKEAFASYMGAKKAM